MADLSDQDSMQALKKLQTRQLLLVKWWCNDSSTQLTCGRRGCQRIGVVIGRESRGRWRPKRASLVKDATLTTTATELWLFFLQCFGCQIKIVVILDKWWWIWNFLLSRNKNVITPSSFRSHLLGVNHIHSAWFLLTNKSCISSISMQMNGSVRRGSDLSAVASRSSDDGIIRVNCWDSFIV